MWRCYGVLDPEEVRLGNATAKEVYCYATENRTSAPYGFDVLGHFSHCSWKPYNITVDFTDLNLYIAHGEAS